MTWHDQHILGKGAPAGVSRSGADTVMVSLPPTSYKFLAPATAAGARAPGGAPGQDPTAGRR